ncbi:MAG: hypothetical protein JWO74_2267 [Solirubrobacterales bacterium]|jgi:hypothetical protein|nr:hypothetical protein [Solirubrobacterales bacterium]
MRRLRRHLSYANVMSSIAVFVVLGGGAYAAATLPRNSVGSKQIKPKAVTSSKIASNAVTSDKVKDGSLLLTDFKPGQLVSSPGPAGPAGPAGAVGPAGAKGDKGETGAAGVAGAAGTAVAYAFVNADGSVNAARSKNVTSANVSHPGAGQYCFHGLSFTPKSVTVSLSTTGGLSFPVALGGTSEVVGGFCGVGNQAGAFMWKQDGSATMDYPFIVWFED